MLVRDATVIENSIDPVDMLDRQKLNDAYREHNLVVREAHLAPRVESHVEKYLREQCEAPIEMRIDSLTTYNPWLFEKPQFLCYVERGLPSRTRTLASDRRISTCPIGARRLRKENI